MRSVSMGTPRESCGRPVNAYQPRSATPGDFDAIVGVVDDWWGRPMVEKLPRLFLDHLHTRATCIPRAI
jgi:hypothetical protein